MTTSPYKFLDSYDKDDRTRFFGRHLETDILLADVVVSRLVVLFAKTGTGKTSLINAGVRPLLEERGYETYVIRVREDPIDSARAVLRKETGRRFPANRSFADQVRRLAQSLDRPLVLFFDQFEEFFLYTVAQDVSRAEEFVGAIGDLYDDRDSGVHVVFSMREEWFVEMGFFRRRIPAIFHNDSNLRLRWFSRDQAKEAIVKPVGEDAFEPALVSRLLDELVETGRAVAGTPSPGEIEPAQLQIVCDTLWQASGNGAITLELYESLRDARRPEHVAQQILDRRLIEEFERLMTREELEILGRLLPELATEDGTKRVRAYGDLVSALLSDPGLQTDPDSIRGLVEQLKEARLLDVVPRESGELVELTHDYLVVRLEELREAIDLIWPRRVLRAGVIPFRDHGELLALALLPDLLARTNDLELDREEAELLLRSALGHLLDVRPILPAVERGGAPTWEIFEARIEQGAEAERVRAIETLTLDDSEAAYRVLRKALDMEEAAAHVVRLLGRASLPRAVGLLETAVGRPGLESPAQRALAELAGLPGSPEVAQQAADALRESFSAALADPARATAAVDALVAFDSTISVGLVEEVVGREDLAPHARAALVRLAASTQATVSARARTALFIEVDRALADGRAGPWCVDLLRQVEDPGSVDVLGRLSSEPPLRRPVEEALQALKDSSRVEVAAAAAKELDRLGGHVPEQRPEPVAAPRRPAPTSADPALSSHYEILLHRLASGRVVPFLGPGVGLIGRPQGESWRSGAFVPSGAELAEYLAERFFYPEELGRDLLRVAQFTASVQGTGPLYHDLRKIFAQEFEPNRLHVLVARLAGFFRGQGRTGALQVIVTTAFDDLLERAFRDVGEPFDLVTNIAHGRHAGRFLHHPFDGPPMVIERPRKYDGLDPKARVVILKLQGGVDRDDPSNDSFVITEDNFLDYLVHAAGETGLPVSVAATVLQSSLLFLGFGLSDWNSRALLLGLKGVSDRSALRYQSWAVVHHPAEVDTSLWNDRNVDVLDVPLEQYAEGLEERLTSFDAGNVPA